MSEVLARLEPAHSGSTVPTTTREEGAGKMSVHKPFDPKLHAEYDEGAKFHVARYFMSQGYDVVYEPEGPYGVDLQVKRQSDGLTLLIEVEVRPDCWKAPGKWKYTSVHVPLRKRDWAGDAFYLFALDKSCRYAIVVPGKVILAAEQQVVKNKYVANGEIFVDIPVTMCNVREL
jgi:hypothetical protein